MQIIFVNDADTGLPHIYKHGVTEQEVEEVLTSAHDVAPGRENSRLAMGTTAAGRVLRVVYAEDESRSVIRVITAYPVHGKALAAYRRRRRRR